MRNTSIFTAAAVALAMITAGEARAQQPLGGNDWLKQFVVPPGTTGYTTPGIANPMDGAGTNMSLKSDWVQDYQQGRGAFARPGNVAQQPGFTVQQNGPVTTYTWYWPGRNNSQGSSARTPVNSSSAPTLQNPGLIAGYNPGVQVVRQRTPNIYSPYQYNVLPANTRR